MKKTNHKINVIKQIEDAVNIVGNHPNQNPDRVFYILSMICIVLKIHLMKFSVFLNWNRRIFV